VAHKFNIGQIVELEPRVLRSSAPGPYEIRHLVAASDRDPSTVREINGTTAHHKAASLLWKSKLGCLSSQRRLGAGV
jgi:hypothetical protein